MRRGEVKAEGGYDGEYGTIRLFTAATGAVLPAAGQFDLFALAEANHEQPHSPAGEPGKTSQSAEAGPVGVKETLPEYGPAALSFFDLDAGLEPDAPLTSSAAFALPAAALLGGLNAAQREAVRCVDRSLIISAGPGAGKTRTLTHRIAFLVLEHRVAPESILAITFTNKAAEEMEERLTALLGAHASAITVGTFHAFAARLLRDHGAQLGIDSGFAICSEEDRSTLLRQACPQLSQSEVPSTLAAIGDAKNQLLGPDEIDEPVASALPRLTMPRSRRPTRSTLTT